MAPQASATLTALNNSSMKTPNLVLILAATLAWGWFIWPGPWHYDQDQNIPIRTHRVTGKTEYLFGGKWARIGDQSITLPPG